jgi:hypothetical protein
MTDPDLDFYIPHGGGYLPMKIVSLDWVRETGETGGLRSVEMTIRAVSVGPPVFNGPQPVELTDNSYPRESL